MAKRIIKGDVNLKKTKKALAAMVKRMKGDQEVVVGLPSDSQPYPDGISVIEVGINNEFGITVPERSFLRSTISDKRREYSKEVEKLAQRAFQKGKPVSIVLNVMGVKMQADVQEKIRSSVPPPNAPSTVEKKGSSVTLIDSGHMHSSIRYVVRKRT